MRATRAYLAGFGTAGSLLAGAAFLFVVASAFISFHGWPSISARPVPAAVYAGSVRNPHTPTRNPAAGTLLANLAAPAPAAGAAGGAATGSTAGRGVIGVASHGTSASLGTPTASVGPTTVAVTNTSVPNPGPHGTVLSTGVKQTTSNLGSTVTSTGSNLGSAVTGVTNTLGSAVNKLNPTLGQTVTTAGQTIGSAVTAATGAGGSALGGGGKTLSTLLGGGK